MTAKTFVPTGTVWMPSPAVILYTPRKLTIADARATLAGLRAKGLIRPDPNRPGMTERVYPLEYAPTEDPRTFAVVMYNDAGELIEADLCIIDPGPFRPTDPEADCH